MKKYNYYKAIKEDIIKYLKENNINLKKCDIEKLEERLLKVQSITGGKKEKYFKNQMQAFQCLFGNEDLIYEVKDTWGFDNEKEYDWVYIDANIRFYLMSRVLREIIEKQN